MTPELKSVLLDLHAVVPLWRPVQPCTGHQGKKTPRTLYSLRD